MGNTVLKEMPHVHPAIHPVTLVMKLVRIVFFVQSITSQPLTPPVRHVLMAVTLLKEILPAPGVMPPVMAAPILQRNVCFAPLIMSLRGQGQLVQYVLLDTTVLKGMTAVHFVMHLAWDVMVLRQPACPVILTTSQQDLFAVPVLLENTVLEAISPALLVTHRVVNAQLLRDHVLSAMLTMSLPLREPLVTLVPITSSVRLEILHVLHVMFLVINATDRQLPVLNAL